MLPQKIFKADTTAGVVKMVVIASVGVIGLALAIKMIRNAIKNNSGNRLVDDENVKLATELNSAIHPGRNWFTDMFVAADTAAIFQMAPKLKNFDDVSKEYTNLYQESLTLELQDALGAEYPAFISALQAAKTGNSAISQAKLNELVVSLRNEIDGINVVSRNLEPFEQLNRLPDTDFIKVVQAYNSKYRPDQFYSDLDGELGNSLMGIDFGADKFRALQKKILTRCKLLFP